MCATAGNTEGSEQDSDLDLARPVGQADFTAAMKRVGPSITRGSEVAAPPGKHTQVIPASSTFKTASL